MTDLGNQPVADIIIGVCNWYHMVQLQYQELNYTKIGFIQKIFKVYVFSWTIE